MSIFSIHDVYPLFRVRCLGSCFSILSVLLCRLATFSSPCSLTYPFRHSLLIKMENFSLTGKNTQEWKWDMSAVKEYAQSYMKYCCPCRSPSHGDSDRSQKSLPKNAGWHV